MRVLLVTERFPYPLDTGGNVRTFHLLRGLAEEHEVTLLATTRGDVEETHVAAIRPYCEAIKVVEARKTNALRDVLALAQSSVGGLPFVLLRHFEPSLHAAVVNECSAAGKASRPFAAVHFNHLDTLLYAPAVPAGLLRVVDQHNVVSNQLETTLRNEADWLRRFVLRLDRARLRAYEARACNDVSACLVCSDDDARALEQLGVRSRIATVPNGVDIEYFVPAPTVQPVAEEAVFVGTLDYDPCEKGVWFFCTEILPLIRAEVPGFRFVAVGKNPSKRLQAFAAVDKSVVLTGRVEDIRPHVWRAGVCVVPLLSGSGTRLKVLEAMAMGVPIVSTTLGAEGIRAADGEHLRLADRAADFAAAVVQTLRDGVAARSIANRARMLVERHYSWPTVRQLLLAEYRALTAGRG